MSREIAASTVSNSHFSSSPHSNAGRSELQFVDLPLREHMVEDSFCGSSAYHVAQQDRVEILRPPHSWHCRRTFLSLKSPWPAPLPDIPHHPKVTQQLNRTSPRYQLDSLERESRYLVFSYKPAYIRRKRPPRIPTASLPREQLNLRSQRVSVVSPFNRNHG